MLDSFERGLERAVNGAFAKTFRSGVQPVEIVSAVRREMDTNVAVIGRDRMLAPNSYEVRLSRPDAERLSQLGAALRDELHAKAREHGAAQGYTFAGPLAVTLRTSDAVQPGTVEVSSTAVTGDVVWQAALDIGGRRFPLSQARTVVGRGSDADITLPDTGTSRRHVEVLWDGKRGMVRDLGSTNGSRLDGQHVSQALLADGQTITIGRTNMVFRVIAQPMPGAGASTLAGQQNATQIIDAFQRSNTQRGSDWR